MKNAVDLKSLMNNMTAEEKAFFLQHEEMHQQFLKQADAHKASTQPKYLFRDEAERDSFNKMMERHVALMVKVNLGGKK